MNEKTNKYLIVALILGIVFHGTSMFFTLEKSYDALIHLFFAEHYTNSWFEPWNYKWYTGFTVMGYPPLVHQSIALFSFIGGLKFGMFTVALLAVILFITGVYRFSLVVTSDRRIAGYASILAVFSSSFLETLHIFGQLPSIVGIALLMHSLPEIYLWISTGKYRYLITAISLIAVTVTSHHVTPIFGMVFFVFPLIGIVILDFSKEQVHSFKEVTFKLFLQSFFKLFWRIISFGGLSLITIIVCILPYWINSKNNPITQVPIPHGSRDNFFEVTSSGLVFFLIPWGILLFFLPYIFYRYFSKRYLFFGLSFCLLTILGTGGTTSIPSKILGETAFNILTLDRFTFWATIMALPMFGEFVYRFVEGDLKELIQLKFGAVYHRLLGGVLAGLFLFLAIFTMNFGYFRPTQPQKIKMLPIVNFLNQDQHDQWRFLPLGFGDQMAWLSAQTKAMTVDGNYHSARRLPELTTRAVERLENSKYRGIEGIGSLQQFLTIPEKYNLKYVFSNDKFYDPMLYFSGWQRLQQLENGIMVWEKLNVPPLSKILPKEEVPLFLKLMWGIIPLLTVLLAFVLNIQMIWYQTLKIKLKSTPKFLFFKNKFIVFPKRLLLVSHLWGILLVTVIFYGTYYFYIKNASQISPKNVVESYYDALDFKEFERAHSYLIPNKVSIDQFMLEVSVTDGILSSYAKLDAIQLTINNLTNNKAKVTAITKWITSLDKLEKTVEHNLEKKNGKWFIQPKKIDFDIPPDQLFSENSPNYYNHGRRRITTQQTHHEDVLKQPVLEILSAKLVKSDNQYVVIGEIQNIDNVPADVVVKATLYTEDNKELANYNAKYAIKHKLLPKETTSFRIDFEGIAWLNKKDVIPKTFDPNQFTPVDLKELPVKFNLQCAGNVATKDLYKNVAISNVENNQNLIKGTLFNFGIKEVTIPQLIFSYYNEAKELIWVDHQFLNEGARVQRKQRFEYSLLGEKNVEIINSSLENCFVNGLPNNSITRKVIPKRKLNQITNQLQEIKGKEFYRFIKIEIDNFIGN